MEQPSGFRHASILNQLDAWIVFLLLCEKHSFSRVAQTIGRDASYVSRLVASLEKELGFELVRRTTRRVVITPEGERAQREMAKVLALHQEAVGRIKNTDECDWTDRIVVCAPPSFCQSVLNRWCMQFSQAHPHVHFDLRLTDEAVEPTNEGVDIAIHSGPAVSLSDDAVRLGALTSIMAASPLYLKKFGTPQTPDDLHRHVTMGFNGRMSGRYFKLFHEGELRSYIFDTTLSVSSTTALINAAVEGFGIVLYACHFMFGNALEEGRLVEVLPEWRQPLTMVHAMVSPASRRRPAVTAYVDFIRQACPSIPGFIAPAEGGFYPTYC